MASSLLVLLDDIASVLDDVATLTKVATKKTAGVLGDDLALNAQQVAGVNADRELPVVWAVAMGSLRNKAILVPAALAISAFAPWAVTPLLMAGGLFLSFEGFEKLVHAFARGKGHDDERPQVSGHAQPHGAPAPIDLAAFEKQRIGGAVRTDFILSAEIIVITLGTVATAPLPTRILVLSAIAVVMTVGVYGLVAGIVKIDDLGVALARRGGVQAAIGRALVAGAPWLMKFLSIAGTAAMFLVGGGILSHNIPALHHLAEQVTGQLVALPAVGGVLATLGPILFDAVVGIVAGFLVVGIVGAAKKLFGRGAAGSTSH